MGPPRHLSLREATESDDCLRSTTRTERDRRVRDPRAAAAGAADPRAVRDPGRAGAGHAGRHGRGGDAHLWRARPASQPARAVPALSGAGDGGARRRGVGAFDRGRGRSPGCLESRRCLDSSRPVEACRAAGPVAGGERRDLPDRAGGERRGSRRGGPALALAGRRESAAALAAPDRAPRPGCRRDRRPERRSSALRGRAGASCLCPPRGDRWPGDDASGSGQPVAGAGVPARWPAGNDAQSPAPRGRPFRCPRRDPPDPAPGCRAPPLPARTAARRGLRPASGRAPHHASAAPEGSGARSVEPPGCAPVPGSRNRPRPSPHFGDRAGSPDVVRAPGLDYARPSPGLPEQACLPASIPTSVSEGDRFMSETSTDTSTSLALLGKYAKAVDHIAIAVNDLEEGIRYYSEHFGYQLFERRRTEGKTTAMVSAVMKAGPITIVLLQGTTEESQVARYVKHYGP